MNLYSIVGSVDGTPDAAELRARLAMWHDEMVAHERKLRSGRTGEACDEECPHAEARMLWVEALDAIGDLALLGRPLRAHVTISRGSHALHHALMAALLSAEDPSRAGDREVRS